MRALKVSYRIGHAKGFPKTKRGDEITEHVNEDYYKWLREAQELFCSHISIVDMEALEHIGENDFERTT